MVLRNISSRYPDNKTFINDFSHKGGSILETGGKFSESLGNLGDKATPFMMWLATVQPELAPEIGVYEATVKGLKYGGQAGQYAGKQLKSVQLD